MHHHAPHMHQNVQPGESPQSKRCCSTTCQLMHTWRTGWCGEPLSCTHDMFLHVVVGLWNFSPLRIFPLKALIKHWKVKIKATRIKEGKIERRCTQIIHNMLPIYLRFKFSSYWKTCIPFQCYALETFYWEIDWKSFQVQMFLWSRSSVCSKECWWRQWCKMVRHL